MSEFNEEIAVVTGGSGGLGTACINMLKKSGKYTISLDIKEPDSEAAKPDLFIKTDVSDYSSVKNAFNKIENEKKKIGSLICLAGVVFDAPIIGIGKGSISEYSLDHWNQTIGVNLTGTFLCTKEFVLLSLKRRVKAVVVTCSSPAADGAPGQGAYAASKAGVEAFTTSIAQEVAPWGIRVCGIRPGLTMTPMAEKYPKRIMENLSKKSCAQRQFQPEEFASAIEFVLSNELAWGKILHLDGGIKL
jgi:3-oxoacyl-[acyl-carrier protein] reductase